MAKKNTKKRLSAGQIAVNRKASHDYNIEARIEAGIVLRGWEVKSIRAGRIQLKDSYVVVRSTEIWLVGTHIAPLTSASTHVDADPVRSRKLLLHRKEIDKFMGLVVQKGYTLIATTFYWKQGKIKVQLALAKGKKSHDKRAAEKDKDWARTQQRLVKSKDL